MLDNDNLTYKKTVIGSALPKQAERAMITLERSQKLDLLIHLLANLRQALIVCGPEGIGKTTLLKNLHARRQDQWHICLLQGSSALSFEAVVNELSRFLGLSGSNIGFDLSSLRAYCEKQKVVLIIDDAGELMPGLIGELVDFADSLSGLRLVFSMTYDEFHIKSASDQTVDDCHFIELPPLNQKQCAEYLQNLSAQPGAMLSFNAVTDSLVENLYRQTNGIPGKLLAEIPKLNQYQSRKKSRLGLWLGVVLVLTATAWVVKGLLPSTPASDTASEKLPETAGPVALQPTITPTLSVTGSVSPSPELPTPADTLNQTPAPTAPVAEAGANILGPPVPTPTIEPSPVSEKVAEKLEVGTPTPVAAEVIVTPQPVPTPAPAETQTSPELVQAAEIKPSEVPVEAITPTPEPKPAKPMSDLDWIKAQPADNYTLQIMVLSNKDSVDRFLKKYAGYRDILKYYTVKQNDQEKYVLIYGSFQSAAEAVKRKTAMPEEFNQGLEKKFKSIQYQIRR
ncbi:MAG: AAA family ATPase [Methylococcaceae bacterium]|nr:AAA family ATPase [Methylococcaceae bacterium]